MRIVLVLLLVSAFASAFAHRAPATAARATAYMSVRIAHAPSRIERSTRLDFGGLRGGEAEGEVVLSPAGTRRASGGAHLLDPEGEAGVAAFEGAANASYRLDIPRVLTAKDGSGDTRLHVRDLVVIDAQGNRVDGGGRIGR